MQHHHIKVLALGLLFGLAWTTTAYGTPGERFHIREDNTSIYEGPTATASVVRHLNKGDRVIEFRRQGSWVKVSQLGAVGKDGWVEISRLAPELRYYSLYLENLQQMQRQREMEEQQREIEEQQKERAKKHRELVEQRRIRKMLEQELYEPPQYGIFGLGGC